MHRVSRFDNLVDLEETPQRAHRAREVGAKIWRELTPLSQKRLPKDLRAQDDLGMLEGLHKVNQKWLKGSIGSETGTSFQKDLYKVDRQIKTATNFLSDVYQAATSWVHKAGGSQFHILTSTVATYELVNSHAGAIVGGLTAGFVFVLRELCYALSLLVKGGQFALDTLLGILGKGSACLVAGLIHMTVMAYHFCKNHKIISAVIGALIATFIILVKIGVIGSIAAAVASPYGLAALALITSIIAIVIALKTLKETKTLSRKFDLQFSNSSASQKPVVPYVTIVDFPSRGSLDEGLESEGDDEDPAPPPQEALFVPIGAYQGLRDSSTPSTDSLGSVGSDNELNRHQHLSDATREDLMDIRDPYDAPNPQRTLRGLTAEGIATEFADMEAERIAIENVRRREAERAS